MMDDNQLKDLLARDLSIPEKPANEWKKIEDKIETKRFRKKFIWPTLATICLLAVISFSQMQEEVSLESAPESEIADFLLKDKLFVYEEDNLYAWVE